MNYEKFNDAMCRLRQAEEDFNNKLLEVLKPFADEMKKQQKEDDDDYYKGLKDMHEAIRLIATDGSDGGMSIFELKDAFDTASVCDIILGYSPLEIMDKTLAWIAKRKESQELHVGDEIEYIKYGKASEKRIVIRIDDREGDEKIIWTIGLDRFDQYGTSTKDPTEKYRKTGKHYDSIPLNTKK